MKVEYNYEKCHRYSLFHKSCIETPPNNIQTDFVFKRIVGWKYDKNI